MGIPAPLHERPGPSLRVAPSSALLLAGLLTSVAAWWLIAPPVITFSAIQKHAGHFALVWFHVFGGTVMLFLGLANLYVGTTRRFFAFAAISAIVITTSDAHKAAGATTFTNTTISLVSLACAWLLAAGMAYRAVRNRRYDSHRDWMIRSYVLAWSFVFCRLASRVPGVEDMGGGSAFIWLSWVGPLVLCEAALQWRQGSAAKRASAVG